MKKLILLIIIFCLSLTLSACGTNIDQVDMNVELNDGKEEDLSPVLEPKEDAVITKEVESEKIEITASTSDDWLTMERPREGFSVKVPKGWYYVSNYKQAVDNGYSALIGFGDSSAVWLQDPPYTIEIVSFEKDAELNFDNYSEELLENDKFKFVIKGDTKYKVYVDLMADSFKFIDKK